MTEDEQEDKGTAWSNPKRLIHPHILNEQNPRSENPQ